MSEPVDDRYYCFCCEEPIERRLFEVSRGVEQVIEGDGSGNPHGLKIEVSTRWSEGLGNYCSPRCRANHMPVLLEPENFDLPNEAPGIGPFEACARCSSPVDMAQPHWAYLQFEVDIDGGHSVLDLDYLAVLCPTCRAPTDLTGSAWLQEDLSPAPKEQVAA